MADRRYRADVAPAARRGLTKLAAPIQRRIIRALHRLEVDPRPRGAKQLKSRPDEPNWRLRVGDYRVIYEIPDSQLLVLVILIGHRGVVYRDISGG